MVSEGRGSSKEEARDGEKTSWLVIDSMDSETHAVVHSQTKYV